MRKKIFFFLAVCLCLFISIKHVKAQAPTYANVQKILDGGMYYVQNRKVYFRFEEEYAVSAPNDNLPFVIFNGQHTDVTSGSTLTNGKVKYGDNRYELNISPSLPAGGYTLQVSNAKNEKWYLRLQVN